MFQPKNDEQSNGNPSRRFGRLAFVVGDPSDSHSTVAESDRSSDTSHNGSDHECTKWLNERLTACYND
jgi:hypothetical protein